MKMISMAAAMICWMPVRYWIQSERNAQMAMGNNYGSEHAQAFAQASTARFITEVQKLALSALMALAPTVKITKTPRSSQHHWHTTQGFGEDGQKAYSR